MAEVYTEETANGAKLQALLIDEGTPLVRAVFDKAVSGMSPPSLQRQLVTNKSKLTMHKIKGPKVLNFDQQKIVYPTTNGAANSSEHFDMALLSLLLGILCNIQPPRTGWGKAPPAKDQSPIACIIRLRLFRNENYGHITNTALSNTKFKKMWKELSDILIKLGADKDKIFQRKTKTIDPEQAKMYKEKFEKLHRDDNEVKDLLVALMDKVAGLQEGQKATFEEEQKSRTYLQELMKTNTELAEKLTNLEQAIAQGEQNQSAEIRMTGDKTRHTLTTYGQQQEELIGKVAELKGEVKKVENAIIANKQNQPADMHMTGEETLRTYGQQQQELIVKVTELQHKFEAVQKAISADRHKQSIEMNITLTTQGQQQEMIGNMAEPTEPKVEPKHTAEEKRPSAEGKMPPNIQTLRKHLQDQYRGELARIRPLPWCDWYLDLEHMFTTLEMVCRDGRGRETVVEAKNMFQSDKTINVPKTIRVEGDPGIGKTTLCYKIVHDWSADKSKLEADNKFSFFQLVLYVAMRKVPHDATNVKSTIVQEVFSSDQHEHEEEFWDYVRSNPGNVLFVLDGLDEMPEETREKLKIADFIRGKIIPGVHVIVTSRPYHCNKQLESCDRHFVIKGYSHDNIYSYIDRYPESELDTDSKQGILKQLHENESLHQLTEHPLNLALLCILWQKNWNVTVLPQTLTGLYELLVLAILKRYASSCPGISDICDSISSLEEMPEPIQVKLHHLNNLAWKFIKKDRLHFPGKAVEGLEKIGFLTKDLNKATRIQCPYWFQFLHKTFQEYFAAKYLQSLCLLAVNEEYNFSRMQDDDLRTQALSLINTLNNCVQNDRYRQVLKFLAGLLGINARCVFEAFRNYLSIYLDEKITSLCLECLHECEAGTELVKYVCDALPRDWRVGSDPEAAVHDAISHLYTTNTANDEATLYSLNQIEMGTCILSCNTYMSSNEMPEKHGAYFIRSNEALYGLVYLLQHQAKTGQDNLQLSNVHLSTGFDNAMCRFLKAISNIDVKVIGFLAVMLHDASISHHDNALINEVCNLLKSDACRDLLCNLTMCSYTSSSLDNLNKLLSSVQSETKLSLYSWTSLDQELTSIPTNQSTFSDIVNTTIKIGSMTRDREASVELYIDCAAETYNSEFVSFSLTNLVSNIKQRQCESTHSWGSLELLFIVRNLPKVEKPVIQSRLDDIPSVLEDQRCCIVSITFECSCEDGSVVSTFPLLQSLRVNQSLTEVSILCDGPDNVAECLRDIFAKNRTLQKLEIGFLHPVDDDTMANIFSSYPIDNPCKITSFSVVMETGSKLDSSNSKMLTTHSYQKTVRAILYICKNMCDGSALQKISFISGPENAMIKTGATLNSIFRIIPVCPGSLLKPFVEAILDSQLVVNLAGMTWVDVTDLQVTHQERTNYYKSDNFRMSRLGEADTGVTITDLFLDKTKVTDTENRSLQVTPQLLALYDSHLYNKTMQDN